MALFPDAALSYLTRAREHDRLAHAYLIAGPSGSGKRDVAARFAAKLNNVGVESVLSSGAAGVVMIEPESKSRRIVVEQIRTLEHSLQMRAADGRRKIAIIADADRLQPQAANAFLKTLEEPPDNSLLLLLTAMPEALPDTIISRCLTLTLSPPSERAETPDERELLALLCHVAAATPGVEVAYRASQGLQRLLGKIREEIADQMEQQAKQEELRYKNATDGAWLETREDYFKAMTESAYLERRSRLIETLFLWWTDVLRATTGLPSLHLSGCSSNTAAVAQRITTTDVLKKLRRLEQLRDHLNRTIQETLAVEVAFLDVFGR